jgi:hypothetical protein
MSATELLRSIVWVEFVMLDSRGIVAAADHEQAVARQRADDAVRAAKEAEAKVQEERVRANMASASREWGGRPPRIGIDV